MARDFLPCLLAVFRRKHLEQFIDLPHALRVFRVLLSQTRSHKFFSLGKDSLALRHLALSASGAISGASIQIRLPVSCRSRPASPGQNRPLVICSEFPRLAPPWMTGLGRPT
jgi:hypothetical protein